MKSGESDSERDKKWFSIKPSGHIPSPRVGHSCVHLKNGHKVIFIGGAAPDAAFNEVYVLDLETLKCAQMVSEKFEPRYEHCSFTPHSDEKEIVVFGGANQVENKNDVLELSLESSTWSVVTTEGSVPTPRTHSATAVLNNNLVVFAGGERGPEPVNDSEVYLYNPEERKWSIQATKGSPPAPRQGHVLVSSGKQIYCHGGMRSLKFFDDLYILEEDGTWIKVDGNLPQPSARAAHGGVFYHNQMYIFGGLSKEGPLNDLWRFNTDTLEWEEIKKTGQPPSPRLDFAMTVIKLPCSIVKQKMHSNTPSEDSAVLAKQFSKIDIKTDNDIQNSGASGNSQNVDEKPGWIPCIMLHGGMDISGSLFNDFWVFCSDS